MGNDKDKIFLSIIAKHIDNQNVADVVRLSWNEFTRTDGRSGRSDNRGSNGRFFEFLIQRILVKNELVPFYVGAEVSLVPNVNFDIILYTQERGPFCLSIKTSLRERYKQAALEAIALKQFHGKSETFCLHWT